MYNDCLIFKFLGFECAEEKAASKMRAKRMAVKRFHYFIRLEIQSDAVNEHILYHPSKCDFNMLKLVGNA